MHNNPGEIQYTRIEKKHSDAIINLCRLENWTSFTEDPDITWQALTAPGVITVVALDSDKIVSFIQLQSDGSIQAHLSLILVEKDHRRQGIGTRLVNEAFAISGARRIDLTTEDMPDFYRSFNHKEWFGFRIHP